jgi:hypothetical protein
MNQRLDHEIKRAIDELVQCAPPPPGFPASDLFALEPAPTRLGRPRVLVGVAALALVVIAGGLGVLSQRPGGPTLQPADTGEGPEATLPSTPPTTVVASVPLPAPTVVSTTQPPSTTQPEPPQTTLEPSGEYAPALPTPMPGTTESPDGPSDAFDGTYFGFLHEGPLPDVPGSVRFDLVQAYSGDDCLARFGDSASQVCTPVGVSLDGPTAQVDVQADQVEIVIRDVNSDLSHRVSGAELLGLINGQPPATGAPADFVFSGGFGFLLTFDQGTVIRIDQPS